MAIKRIFIKHNYHKKIEDNYNQRVKEKVLIVYD